MKRRILSSLMALVLVFGLLPATAFATEEAPDTEPEVTAVGAPSAEEGETPAGNTIYVDAVKGDDAQPDVGTTAEKAYKTVEKAVTKAVSGDTIQLGEGNYTLYGVSSEGHTKNKDLTFVGAGTGKTTWNIGTGATDAKGQNNGDFSFRGNNKLVFKNMTLKAGVTPSGDQVTRDYMGFAHTNITIVEDCVIDGITAFWGYESAMFKNTTFNCPVKKFYFLTLEEYAIWTYSSPVMTFDSCTFNSSGKVINVYTDYGAGKHDITVNFMGCTVNNTSSNKAVLNINDSNMGSFKYRLNISGSNTVNGVKVDKATCSRLFGFGGKADSNNKGNTIVKFGDTVVWEDGKMVNAEAYHNDGVTVDGVSYNNGVDGANNSLYAEGYKDNQVTVDEGEWTKDANGIWSHKVTKKCGYCSYKPAKKSSPN